MWFEHELALGIALLRELSPQCLLVVLRLLHRVPSEINICTFGALTLILSGVRCLCVLLVPGSRGLHFVLEIVALRVHVILYPSHSDLELADVIFDAFVLDGGAVGRVCLVPGLLL